MISSQLVRTSSGERNHQVRGSKNGSENESEDHSLIEVDSSNDCSKACAGECSPEKLKDECSSVNKEVAFKVIAAGLTLGVGSFIASNPIGIGFMVGCAMGGGIQWNKEAGPIDCNAKLRIVRRAFFGGVAGAVSLGFTGYI